AVELLRKAGHDRHAELIERDLLGRNVLAGRWTFQIVEDYDDNYWSLFRGLEQGAREDLAGGRRHLYEARLKQAERTEGRRGHEATPRQVAPS
ncbi:MAG: hypothetical protein ACLGIF_00895, partial [Actinomycetes bacterium]